MQIRKKEVKLSLFSDNLILCIQKFKGFTKKLLKLITAVKLWDTKPIYINQFHVNTLTNEVSEKEIKKQSHLQ